jgi:aerobic C4-dicarboxylate transport protein
VTNLLGNCVAVFAVSRWEGALDLERARKVLDGEIVPSEAEEPDAAEKATDTADETPKAEVPAQAVQSAKEPASEVG